MANINAQIMKLGTIRTATKLPVITLGIGEVGTLNPVEGVIWKNDEGKVIIRTKENPEGELYPQDWICVVRILGGNVLIDGEYDIYAISPEKAKEMFQETHDLWVLLGKKQRHELLPIFDAATMMKATVSPEEHGRQVVVITRDMVDFMGKVDCICTWNEKNGRNTTMVPGDVFVIEDMEKAWGYRIGAKEFALTYRMELDQISANA